ncbi:hypothetical protein HDV06_002896 [Boothiomyces sp. JEL0866]|nr:hypothetical protein HDV06_002896 [Boothiomyces sp. JEL0866]
MIKFILFCAVLANPCPYSTFSKRSEGPFNKSAPAQLEQLWSEILASRDTPSSYAYSNFDLLLVESMHPTVDTVSDELPMEQRFFSSTRRQKRVHGAGAVAKVKFTAVANQYTGLYQGAENALIRFSLATEPKATSNFTGPGAAIKFFRDNSPSANIFANLGIDGQYDWNLFSNNLSNIISPNEGGALAGSILLHSFGQVSNWPTVTGLSGAANKEANGTVVANPIYPFQIVFRPTDNAKQLVETALAKATPDDAYKALTALKSVPIGTDLWTIWASPHPKANFKQIGQVSTTSPIVLNSFGNTNLFFQHQTFEQDTAPGSYGESWAKICPTYRTCITCHSLANNNCVFE